MRSVSSIRRRFVSLVAIGGLHLFLNLSLPVTVTAQPPVVVNFEGLTAAPVFNQYASQGVTFNGPLATDFSVWPGFAHSGTGGIQLCFAQEFCSAPLTINFTTGQAHAKLWIGYISQITPAQSVKMQALDAGGAVLGQVTTPLGPSTAPIPINIPLEINTPTANIRQLVLRFDAGPGVTTFNNGLLIDDVEFSSVGPTPACGTSVPPSVTLLQPRGVLPGQPATVQIDEFMLQGAAQTAVPLDEAGITVTRPGGSARSFNLLNSSISTNGGSFGPTRISGILLPGTNTVSVRVRNCSGTSTDNKVVIFTPIAAGTGFKFLGMEVTQVIQDLQNSVPLVADKPTVVRIYLNVKGPTSSIAGISGAITATKPGGSTLVPLLRSINTITVDSTTSAASQRGSMTASLNFILPPAWVASSTLHFQLSKLYIDGHESSLPCDGCRNLDEIEAPRYVVFRPTKTLNLVLAPYVYDRSSTPTPDTFLTPMGALQWLNNVYPLSGNFPGPSGVKLLRYLPMRTTTRNLFNASDGGDFLDDLEDILSDLQDQNDWPSDARLLAMTPFGGGGRARRPGKVSYVDTWAVENGVVQQVNFEGYGDIWSHEIGHNYGRKHLSNSHGEGSPDLGSPFPHGGIGHPGVAMSTNYWLANPPSIISPGVQSSGSPHAHDFMSYGGVNSPGGEHTRSWVSPYTYNALFSSFEDLTPTSMAAPSPRIEKLVVAGRINRDRPATLRPFRRVTTRYKSGSGTNGEYTIVLIDGGGRNLISYRFDPQEVEDTTLLSFSEYVPWKNGTKVIEIRRGKSVLATRTVSLSAPWVRLISPKGGEVWGREKATITWAAGDDDKDSLTYTVLYNSGLDSIWLPIANGVKETSATVDTTMLPGSPRARIRVRATDDVNTTEAESYVFAVSDKQPRVVILSPTVGQLLASDAAPQLIAAAYDPEDGMLPETSLVWSSDRDGVLEKSDCKALKPLSRGRHVITLTATDSTGNSVTAKVNILVDPERLNRP